MKKPKVYITRLIPEKAIEMVKEVANIKIWEEDLPPPREVLMEEIKKVDGIISLLTDKIDKEAILEGNNLKVISNYAVGYDNIDVRAASEKGIAVTNTPGVLTETTADLAFALLLSTARKVVEGANYVKKGKWKTWGPQLLLGQDIYGATLGIVGAGRIGTAVAKRAKGFDMKILYYSRTRNEKMENELGAKKVEFEEILFESDFISIHVPLTEKTNNMFNENAFKKMKKSSILINTARGPVIDEKALYSALKDNKLAGAGLDVTNPEPVELDNPLLKLKNVVIVPHIASASIKTRTKMGTMAAENLIAVLKGKKPPYPVN